MERQRHLCGAVCFEEGHERVESICGLPMEGCFGLSVLQLGQISIRIKHFFPSEEDQDSEERGRHQADRMHTGRP